MSIYAKNLLVDESGESILLKHLNKLRVDRSRWMRRAKGWNKSGIKGRSQHNLLNRRNRYKRIDDIDCD